MRDQATTPSVEVHIATGIHVSLPIAGLGGRSYAFIIDWHIRLLLALGWMLAAMVIASGGLDFSKFRLTGDGLGRAFVLLGFVTPVLIYFLYHPVLEILMKGRTPGKRMAGLRIVAKDGRPATAGALLIRNVFRLIDSLPVFYVVGITSVVLTRDSLSIGDLAAGTVLVYQEQVSHKKLVPLVAKDQADTETREIIADLLDRWKELDESARIRLADTLLNRCGVVLTHDGRQRAISRDRHARLKQILEGAE